MALCKRLIARLDIKGSRLIKGIRFEGLRVLGDPCEAALRYAEAGADELLYVDAVASLYGRNGLTELLRRTSREVFIPITAGGGVRSVPDAAALLAAGADKIAVNTAAMERPELITELARAFGSQCVVVSIQTRRTGPQDWEAMGEAGRERSGRHVLNWIKDVQELGAGEILLTSVDQDGTCSGPDEALIEALPENIRIPLVIGGGFASVEDAEKALTKPQIAAISIGAALHTGRLELNTLKYSLKENARNYPIRLENDRTDARIYINSSPLTGIKVGIIDYGMGNQQSLINALEKLGATTLLTSEREKLGTCTLQALPGVGAFPLGMEELEKRNLIEWIKNWVNSGKPLLGICLGMQMLFDNSEEFGLTKGLQLIRGNVKALPEKSEMGETLVVPHMGWNRLQNSNEDAKGLTGENFNQYFVHSYAPTNVEEGTTLYNCRHGHKAFTAAVRKKNVAGFQFHPERSGAQGLTLLSRTCLALLNQ